MEEKVLDILVRICEDDVVKNDKNINILEEGLLDSLAFTELLFTLEEELGILISPSEITREEIDTPQKIIDLVNARG